MAGLSKDVFGDIGGAVNDIFGAFASEQNAGLKAQGLRVKAMGDRAEAENYDRASVLALQNKQFTEESTAIQQYQLERNTMIQIGGQKADIAGAGFSASGSALDILRDSASQGALAKAVLGQQGLITEAGYQEQSDSYVTMAKTARATADAEDQMASRTEDIGRLGAIGGGIGAAIKGGAAIAALLL